MVFVQEVLADDRRQQRQRDVDAGPFVRLQPDAGLATAPLAAAGWGGLAGGASGHVGSLGRWGDANDPDLTPE